MPKAAFAAGGVILAAAALWYFSLQQRGAGGSAGTYYPANRDTVPTISATNLPAASVQFPPIPSLGNVTFNSGNCCAACDPAQRQMLAANDLPVIPEANLASPMPAIPNDISRPVSILGSQRAASSFIPLSIGGPARSNFPIRPVSVLTSQPAPYTQIVDAGPRGSTAPGFMSYDSRNRRFA